jgi:hypothetical protein
MFFLDQSAWSIQTDKMVLFQHESDLKTTRFERSTFHLSEVNQLVITRNPKMCNFLDYK